MPNRPNNVAVIDTSTRRLRALVNYARPQETISINGVQHTASEIMAIYQTSIDSRGELATMRAKVKRAIDVCAQAEAARVEADRALKAWAVHRFGVTSAEAFDFGFPPPRAPTLTVEAKALSVLRAKATREARHTMGKRQKEMIRGVVPPEPTASAVETTLEPAR
jgi:hypothetical protein